MKKHFLLAFTLLLSTIGFSQISITDFAGKDLTSGTFLLPPSPDFGTGYHFVVTNNGTSAITYIVQVQSYTIPADALGLAVCANGNCVPLSSTPLNIGNPTTLAAGASFGAENSGEVADISYVTNGSTGVATITIKVFEEGNPSNSATFSLDSSVTGISDLANSATLSAYPNPTNNFVTFTYAKQFSEGTIIVQNIIGKTVNQIKLNKNSTSVKYSVTNLPTGVYLYSLISNGEKIHTKKLIVK